jgi:PAS domain S-box-containing protein
MVELKKTDQLFETILQYITDPVVLIDNDFKILWANKAFQNHSGYKTKKTIDNYCYRLTHHSETPCKLPNHLCPLVEVQKTGKAATVTHTHFDKKGNKLFIEIMAYPVNDENGKIIQFVYTYRDITEHKRAEEALRESERLLARSQEISHLGSWELDLVNKKLTWSDEVYRIFGLQPQEFRATYEAFLEAVHPDDRAAVDAAYSSSLREGRDTYEIEHRIIRKSDGEIRVVHEKCEHIRDSSGQIIRSVGIVQDITERKQAEEEIQKLNKELKQKLFELIEANKELDAFNYTVSHDLKVPLVIIGGFTNRFIKKYSDKLDTKEKDMFHAIQKHTREMERLIKDLLAFSRAGRKKIKPTEIDMGNLVTTVLDGLKPLSEGKMIKYDIKTLPTAYGDQTLIKQVFINLVSNAIKFTTNKKMATIEVGGWTENNENVYCIKDNGMGFDSQDSDKLFNVFQRLHGIEELEGSGVGLSIVQRIVKRHGGRVWAEGKVNEGASIYFSLPNRISEDS